MRSFPNELINTTLYIDYQHGHFIFHSACTNRTQEHKHDQNSIQKKEGNDTINHGSHWYHTENTVVDPNGR
jgi:hypothetical protein